MASSNTNIELYPIGIICTRCGIKPVTLRAWERRYGLFVPRRTPKGHRLYCYADLARIKKIQFLLSQGYAIRQVKQLLKEKISQTDTQQPGLVIDFERLATSLKQMNTTLILQELGHFIREYSPEIFADQVYPQMLEYLNQNLWPKHSQAELARQLLLDLFCDRLKQFLLQAKTHKQQPPIWVIGYRTGMISTRIIQALLIANILSARGHDAMLINNCSHLSDIIALAKEHKQAKIIISTTPDAFYQSQIINILAQSAAKNVYAYATSWPNEHPRCIDSKLANIIFTQL